MELSRTVLTSLNNNGTSNKNKDNQLCDHIYGL